MSISSRNLSSSDRDSFERLLAYGLSEQDSLDMIGTSNDIDVNPLAVLDDTVDSNGSTD